jgi:hypothetical protein
VNTLALSLYDDSVPSDVTRFLTSFDTPGEARAVAINDGLAYVADGSRGLQVVNFLAYDALGQAPTVTLNTNFVNNEITEGALVRASAQVSDDVQVREVTFFNDGEAVFTDVAYPFEHRFRAPAAGSVINISARATDTGGNNTMSATTTATSIEDTVPPVVSINSPSDGDATTTPGWVDMNIVATDNVAVDTITFTLNGEAVTAQQRNLSYYRIPVNLPVGSYPVNVTVTDVNGLSSTTTPITVDVIAFGVGDQISGNIDSPFDIDSYSFSVPQQTTIYVDNQQFVTRDVEWQLTDDALTYFFDAEMRSNDAGIFTLLPDTLYTLTISTRGDTDDYRFQIWNVPPPDTFDISLDQAVSEDVPGAGAGNIETPGVVDVYTFTLTEETDVYFDAIDYFFDQDWRLTDGSGTVVFDQDFDNVDPGTFTLPVDTYTLEVDGVGDDVGTYSFQLWTVPEPQTFDIAVGDTISDGAPTTGAGNIESPGAVDVYRLSFSEPTSVYIDVETVDGRLAWSLGEQGDDLSVFDKPGLFNFPAGDFAFTVTNSLVASSIQNNYGTYGFTLWPYVQEDFTPALNTAVDGETASDGAGNIEQPGSYDRYTFDISSGQRLNIDWYAEDGNLRYWLYDGDGDLVGSFTLPSDYTGQVDPGTIVLFVGSDDTSNNTGTYAFWLHDNSTFDNDTPQTARQVGTLPYTDAGTTAFATDNNDVDLSCDSFVNHSVWYTVTGNDNTWTLSTLGSTFDGVLGVYTGTPTNLTEVACDRDSGPGLAAALVLTTQADTTYYVRLAGEFSDDFGHYELTIDDLGSGFPLTFGDTVSEDVPLPGAGRIDLEDEVDTYVFDMAADSIAYLQPLSADFEADWLLRDPQGVVLFNRSFSFYDSFDEQYELSIPQRIEATENGTYSLFMQQDAFNPEIGTYSFALYDATPQEIPINLGEVIEDGNPAATPAGVIAAIGETYDYTVELAADSEYFLHVLSGDLELQVDLLRPDGTRFATHTLIGYSSFSDAYVPQSTSFSSVAAGTYTLRVYSLLGETGSFSFALYDRKPQVFNINLGDTISDGVPAAGAGNLEYPGARDRYDFTITDETTLYLDKDETPFAPFVPVYYLVEPDGSERFFSTYLDIDQPGDYSLLVEASNEATGAYGFTIYDATPQSFSINTGDMVSDGVPAAGAGNIETIGVGDVYSFDLIADQQIVVEMLASDAEFDTFITRQQGSTTSLFLTNDNSDGTVTLYTDDYTASQSGTHTLTVRTDSFAETSTGTYSFKLWDVPAPQSFDITLGDTISDGVPAAGAGNLEQPGAMDEYTFSANAGDYILIEGLAGQLNADYELRSPSDTIVVSRRSLIFRNSDGSYSYVTRRSIELTDTGVYTLRIFTEVFQPGYGTYSLRVAPEPPPQSDDFDDSVVIDALPFQHTQSNRIATRATDDPTVTCRDGYDFSVWYTYTPTEDGRVVYSTNGTSFYNVLAVYTGTRGNLTEVGCDVNGNALVGVSDAAATNLASLDSAGVDTDLSVDFPAAAGVTYHIMVAGRSSSSSNTGDVVLSANVGVTNDIIDDATEIAALPFVAVQDVSNATASPGEPDNCGYTPSYSVWFSFMPSTTETIRASANDSNFDAQLSVYTGTPGALTQVDCINYWENTSLDVTVTPGETYWYQVSAYPFSTSTSTLNMTFSLSVGPPPLANDEPENATDFAPLPFSGTFNTGRATSDDADPIPSCTNNRSDSTWYTYTPSADQLLLIDADQAFVTGYIPHSALLPQDIGGF